MTGVMERTMGSSSRNSSAIEFHSVGEVLPHVLTNRTGILGQRDLCVSPKNENSDLTWDRRGAEVTWAQKNNSKNNFVY